MKKIFFIICHSSHFNFFSLILLITFLFFTSSCNNLTEPPPDDKKTKWEIIPELAEVDVRYILKHQTTVYLTGLFTGRAYRGSIWKTHDGENWTMLRTFEKAVGPLAINGDSLFCLGDSLFKYIIPTDNWVNVCRPWPLTSDVQAVSEMIFLKNELYAMQTYFSDAVQTFRIYFDGTIEDIPVLGYTYGGAKFIIKTEDAPFCYVRGQYHKGGFYSFDGKIFTKIKNGLSDKEWMYPPTNSMEIYKDTLFAGFKFPGLIKYLDNNTWKTYTDTLPFNKVGQNLYYTEPTEIVFVNERMFVSTDALGILEWTKDFTWAPLSEGLRAYSWVDLYHPVVFLESINSTLIAAYGAPGYAPWGGTGVYKYELKN